MNEAFTIYKLIILYTLNEIESPLTFGLISDILPGMNTRIISMSRTHSPSYWMRT